MNDLQTLFDEIIGQHVTTDVVLRQAIEKKFAANGLALNDRELGKILEDVRNDDSISTEESDNVDDYVYLRISHDSNEIEITEEDLSAATEAITADLQEEYSRVIAETSRLLLKRIRRNAGRTLKANRGIRARFEAR